MEQLTSKRAAAERRKKQFSKLISSNSTYPLATVTYHGPSPDKATKIVVGILPSKDQPPIFQSWTGENIAEDVKAASEIAMVLKKYAVARVLTSEWVLSCPHEEGVDYPTGSSCPLCPEWD